MLDLIRLNSLWPLLSGLACCAMEMMSAATSRTTWTASGMFPFRASPRQADVLIVAGTLTTKMAGPLVRLWEQMPEPKWCVAMGDCTCSGGRYKRSYATVEGIDRVHAGRRLRARLPAPPGGPHLRDDEAPAARQGAARALGRAGASARRSRRASERVDEALQDAACEARFGDRLTAGRVAAAPRQDRDPRSAPGDVTDVMRALHDDPELGFELLADLAGVDTGAAMQVVYHLWTRTTPDWLRVIADGLPRDDPRVPSVTVPLDGRRVGGARGLRHVRHHLRGQPRPAPHLHAARLHELPAAQGLPASPTTRHARRAMGVRHMEQTHTPRGGDARPMRRSPGA